LKPVPPRKQKIELRPGPLKATPPSQTATSTVANSSLTDAEKDTKTVNGAVLEPGIVETAKIDYSEASKHGILAPPPADASKIGRLWHQAKEYFVCSS
jgi:LETM1 and EF-hand domain-containing protein 1, mitochondrial